MADTEPVPAMTLCVCVPARNEAERLPVLLDALAAQDWPTPVMVPPVPTPAMKMSMSPSVSRRIS